jgi:hypothetical protein
MLEQEVIWINPQGYAHEITRMGEEDVLWCLDFALANARKLRIAWSAELKQTFDVDQRARRWMLDKIVIRALMRRLIAIELEKEQEARIAKDQRNHRFTALRQASLDSKGNGAGQPS